MKYDKLVRDKIPEIIKQNGDTSVTHIANDKEYWQKLKKKLSEEVQEFIESDGSLEEFADIMEVLKAIREFKNIDSGEVENIRQEKSAKRGGFAERIILDETK